VRQRGVINITRDRKLPLSGLSDTRRSLSDSESPGLFQQGILHLEPQSQTTTPSKEKKSRTVLTPAEKAAKADANSHKGHRQRLRARFLGGGEQAVPDYELLEMVLFNAIPVADVKPLAKRLLAEFKSFPDLVHASRARLLAVPGVGPRVIDELKLIKAAAVRLTQREVNTKDPLNSWQAVLDYLKAAQSFDTKESFRIIFLDKRNQLIADEVQQRGTVDHTPVYIREVIARALELSSTAVILVHNHPSGDPSPSRADIDMTKLIMSAGQPLGISVHDHIIIGRQGHFSMKAARVI
jgi:DNA repair protein RadC